MPSNARGLQVRRRISDEILKVSLLIALDRGEQVLSTAVEVMLDTDTRVGQEVDKGSLLDEIVLFVDTDVFDLFL